MEVERSEILSFAWGNVDRILGIGMYQLKIKVMLCDTGRRHGRLGAHMYICLDT